MGTRLVGWHNDCSVDGMGHRGRHPYRVGTFGRRIDFLGTSSWVCACENSLATSSRPHPSQCCMDGLTPRQRIASIPQ